MLYLCFYDTVFIFTHFVPVVLSQYCGVRRFVRTKFNMLTFSLFLVLLAKTINTNATFIDYSDLKKKIEFDPSIWRIILCHENYMAHKTEFAVFATWVDHN